MNYAIRDKMRCLELDEKQLIERLKGGGEEALNDFLTCYESALYNFGLRMCGQPQDAEDLVQETMVTALRYLSTFRGDAKLTTWLYKVASSLCTKMRRKADPLKDGAVSLDEIDENPDHPMSGFDLPDPSRVPETDALRAEISERVSRAVSGLPRNYRLVLVLRDMEGFSTEETAEILEISPDNVKQRLHRARLRVKDDLRDFWESRVATAAPA